MLKDLFKKADYFWLFFVLTIVLCFGYFITNPVMGIDDEQIEWFVTYNNILQVNRPGKVILKALFNYEFVPFAYDMLCIGCHILTALLTVDIFRKYLPSFSKIQALIFSVLVISFPFIAYQIIFMESNIDIGFGLLAAAFAANLFHRYLYDEKKGIYIFSTIVLLIFSVSLYESEIFIFILISLFVILYSFIFENFKDLTVKSAVKQTLLTYSFVLSSIILCHLVLLFLQLIADYFYNRGKSEYMMYDFSSIHAFIDSFIHCMKEFLNLFSINMQNSFSCGIVLFSIISLLIVSMIYSIKKKNIFILALSLLMILTPFSYFFLTGFYTMPYRVFLPAGYLCACTFIILFRIINFNYILSKIFLFAVFLIVFHSAKEMNNIFYTENVKFQNDKFFAYSIDYDLKRLNLDSHPIVFAGVRDDLELPHSYYERAAEINISTFNWDRYDSVYGEIFVRRPFKFMRSLGYKIDGFFENSDGLNDDDIKYYLNILNENVPDMAVYPKEDSIRDIGEFVIIKIGRTRFQKSE